MALACPVVDPGQRLESRPHASIEATKSSVRARVPSGQVATMAKTPGTGDGSLTSVAAPLFVSSNIEKPAVVSLSKR